MSFLVHERYAKRFVSMFNELISNFIHIPTQAFHHVKTEKDSNVDVNDIGVVEQKVTSIIDRHTNFCLT